MAEPTSCSLLRQESAFHHITRPNPDRPVWQCWPEHIWNIALSIPLLKMSIKYLCYNHILVVINDQSVFCAVFIDIWAYKILPVSLTFVLIRKSKYYVYGIWNITPNLHTNFHFWKMWAESWTIMQEASFFIHGPKRRKENHLLSLKRPCWVSVV